MNLSWIKYLVAIGALALAGIHLIWPDLPIDATFILLLVIAIGSVALPNIAPFLKSLELPGGLKIELRDAKAATEKAIPLAARAEGKAELTRKVIRKAEVEKHEPLETLRRLAGTDPNLALVGFRIELEKRLLGLAERYQLDPRQKSLPLIVRQLRDKGAFPHSTAVGLIDLISFGNQAAHGAEVSVDAADWVLDLAPNILGLLDTLDGRPSDG